MLIAQGSITPIARKFTNGRKLWLVEREFSATVESPNFWLEMKAPAKMRTDLGSVPRFAWRICSPEQYPTATILHDEQCESKVIPAWLAAAIFYWMLRLEGAPLWQAWLMWAAVRVGGPQFRGAKARFIGLLMALVLGGPAPAHAETLLISFVGDYCPHCRRWERTLAEPQVQRDLAAAKVRSLIVNEKTLTQSQADNWRLTGVPLVALGQTDDRGQVKVMRRSEGPLSADELRAWLREVAQ